MKYRSLIALALVLSGLAGCVAGSENDVTYELAFTQGFKFNRHVAESKTEKTYVQIDDRIIDKALEAPTTPNDPDID